ncbi:hypothetical protein NMY22_g1890 [Coprinellus aureogranulatus]|nr:hypothetical protein NMY22_g1890 [Coprinellus aureogranulatus]
MLFPLNHHGHAVAWRNTPSLRMRWPTLSMNASCLTPRAVSVDAQARGRYTLSPLSEALPSTAALAFQPRATTKLEASVDLSVASAYFCHPALCLLLVVSSTRDTITRSALAREQSILDPRKTSLREPFVDPSAAQRRGSESHTPTNLIRTHCLQCSARTLLTFDAIQVLAKQASTRVLVSRSSCIVEVRIDFRLNQGLICYDSRWAEFSLAHELLCGHAISAGSRHTLDDLGQLSDTGSSLGAVNGYFEIAPADPRTRSQLVQPKLRLLILRPNKRYCRSETTRMITRGIYLADTMPSPSSQSEYVLGPPLSVPVGPSTVFSIIG